MNSKIFCSAKQLLVLAILFILVGFLSSSIIRASNDQALKPQDKVSAISSLDTITCGDVNGIEVPPYGKITLADAVYLWNFLFRGGPAPVPDTCVGDVNGIGGVSVQDWMVIPKYLYKDCDPPADTCCNSGMMKEQPGTDILNSMMTADTNIMMVENTTARPGKQGHEINVSGSWNSELGAYGVVMLFDTSKIDIVEVSTEGTKGENGLVISNYLGNYSPLKVAVHMDSLMPPDSGVLFKVIVNVKETAPLGETDLILINQAGEPPLMNVYSLSNGMVDILPELVNGTLTIGAICGDFNGDGEVTASDIIYVINFLFKGGFLPLCAPAPYLACGDVNSDGDVTVSDVVYLINHLFKGGPEPDCPPAGFLTYYSDCKSLIRKNIIDSIGPDQDCIEYQYDGEGILEINHINAGFNCCPHELAASITVNENVINIEENENLEGAGCHCLCLFDLDLKILNLDPGEYTIRVIEPYLCSEDELLEFNISLSSSPSSGSYCAKRSCYPWGILK
ncbi:MAG: hypothetical protein OEV55_07525 [candidate division Zixibacteria bacterium]|nr:hypothetical protein [candidate division Zixibacteria bacterium]